MPPASTTQVNVQINQACTAFTPCAGDPQGTYDYAEGCIGDVFKVAKQNCPTLDTSNAKVEVAGSLYFVGPALSRDATVKISGTVVVPQACAAGQCAAAETLLKSYFDTVTCTGTSSCTCTITNTETTKNATTYTVAGNTLTTADGESYQICAMGTTFQYMGKSLGAEEGTWKLNKR